MLAVDLGTPGDAVRRALGRRQGRRDRRGRPVSAHPSALAVAADEEALPFRDGSLDLVVSALVAAFVNDLPGALVQIRRALRPDGLFLAALLGGDTLTELRQAFAQAEAEIEGGVSPRVAPFADLRELGALLQRAGFALPVTDVDRVTVRYASPLRADARSAPHGRDQRAGRAAAHAAPARDADAHGGDLRRAFADPMAACVRRSISCGCRAGRRMRASSSRSSPARRSNAWRMRLGTKEQPAGEKAERRCSVCASAISVQARGRGDSRLNQRSTPRSRRRCRRRSAHIRSRSRAFVVAGNAPAMQRGVVDSATVRVRHAFPFWAFGIGITAASSGARSAARPRAASDSPRSWFGRTQASFWPSAASPSPPSAGTHRAASADESPRSCGSRKSAARDTLR